MKNLGELLLKELEVRQKKNPRYSLRAFAKHLDLDAATLSQIMNAKRCVSVEKAKGILEKLSLASTERNAILLALIHNESMKLSCCNTS